jgi:hypothetical protein
MILMYSPRVKLALESSKKIIKPPQEVETLLKVI